MDEYNKVVQVYNKLCKERNDSQFWAVNILDSTKTITDKLVWQNFYAYMADENHEFTDQWQHSLGDIVDKGLSIKQEDDEITFKTKTVQNGNVTYIRMTPNILIPSNKDGEQVARFPETIQEKASGHESEGSDEKSEC